MPFQRKLRLHSFAKIPLYNIGCRNPYHKIEIKGNTIYVSLKSEMVTPKQCPLHFAIKGDNDKHRDLFWLIPESSILYE